MQKDVISELFKDQLQGVVVTHAFFSTYSFEPDFFELEVMPLLLGSPALSLSEPLRAAQLRRLMQLRRQDGKALNCTVCYDSQVFSPVKTPQLEVDYRPFAGGVQHAKLVLLLGKKAGKSMLLVAAGSFNVTRAGWWENIECGHLEILDDQHAPLNLLESLDAVLACFNDGSPALNAIAEQLSAWRALEQPRCAVQLYFSKKTDQSHFDFRDFISSCAPVPPTQLEVVSPFFPNDGNNALIHDWLGDKEVAVLLPQTEERGVVALDESVYRSFAEQGYHWSQWQNDLNQALVDNKYFRKLHAKVFHCLGPSSWLFVGSVNLSQKAFTQNVEAGFWLPQGSSPLLNPVTDEPIEFDAKRLWPEPADAGLGLPPLWLHYDWQRRVLRLKAGRDGRVRLGSDNTPLWEGVVSAEKEQKLDDIHPYLEPLLCLGALLTAHWQEPAGRAEGTVLVSQSGIFMRPEPQIRLDMTELLRLYQQMMPAESQLALIAEKLALMLREQGGQLDEELSIVEPHQAVTDVYSLFSEINNGFWQLRQRLQKGGDKTRDYYLLGRQPDALAAMVEAVADKEPVTCYLTLLSVQEILSDHPELDKEPAFISLKEMLAAGLTKAREALSHVLPEPAFLSWFDEMFSAPIQTAKE